MISIRHNNFIGLGIKNNPDLFHSLKIQMPKRKESVELNVKLNILDAELKPAQD